MERTRGPGAGLSRRDLLRRASAGAAALTRWTEFRKVVLPLSGPAIATTAMLCLVFSLNDYAFASTFSGPGNQTLPTAASQLVTQTPIDWGQLTAIGTIVVAPMIVVALIVCKWLLTGLTLGAVTGE
jgi:multiple sugar transport system permease protein